MTTTISKTFAFEAAHTLPWHKGKCSRMHGHSYRFTVELAGEVDRNGIIIDFDELVPLISTEILDAFDHRYLNDLMENPTAERIAAEIFRRLADAWQRESKPGRISAITVWETAENAATARA
jgi:6-pyruvoyltetrahydropterin/6-carboxytetrahydropterin synthase